MSEGVLDRLMQVILPFWIEVTSVDGTWKLNQDKSADARIGAVFGLEALVESGAAARIAVSMRDLPE